MRKQKLAPEATIVLLLSEDMYSEATAAVDDARKQDEKRPGNLERLASKAMEHLAALAKPTPLPELVEGHRYGFLYLSYDATANRNGQMVPNHGELYISYGNFCRDVPGRGACLVSKNAWGLDDYTPVLNGTLLFEFPTVGNSHPVVEPQSIEIKIGGRYTFMTLDTRLSSHSGETVTVLRPLTEDEADIADVGPMFKVEFEGGFVESAFIDELQPIKGV